MTENFAPSSVSLTTTVVFAAALCLNLLLKFWLAGRQIRHVAHNRGAVPLAFAEKLTLPAHQKAADYTITKVRFGMLELTWGAMTLLAWTLFGGLSALNQLLVSAMGNSLWQQVALVVAFSAIGGVLDLPFTLYQTFVIEERFGFNKMSFALWLKDAAMSLAVSVVIGVPLIVLVLWIMGSIGPWWWWVWGVLIAVSVMTQLIYPSLIAPLFNKFQPLEDQGLKDRVTLLMARCGFIAKDFFVMDGSKRSAHSNAYFTGFGVSKRVVFYDTLLAQLTAAEVDAVLAHELGHFKHRHLSKTLVGMHCVSLVSLLTLGWVSQQAWFYTGLGVAPNLDASNNALALLLIMMVLPLAGAFIGPAFAQFSRKNEFEADAYAAQQTDGLALASAVLKLYDNNASTLTPDPIYVRFYYSHPQASERLGRLLKPAAAI